MSIGFRIFAEKFQIMDIVKFNSIEERIIVLRDVPILLDSDVSFLYGVETKRINEAVSKRTKRETS